jgi:hypothetical protein
MSSPGAPEGPGTSNSAVSTGPDGNAAAGSTAPEITPADTSSGSAASTSGSEPSKPAIVPGISAPEMPSADEVTLAEDAMVVGIMIGDQHRAYVCEAMSQTSTSVVNDLVQKTPVTVTYHAATKGIRVFSGADSDKPLDVAVQADTETELTLFFENQSWPQSSDAIPLKDVDFVHTEWIAWKTEHPETRVFQGTPAAPAAVSSP